MGKASITSPAWRTNCIERYGFDPMEPMENGKDRTGEDMVFQVADNKCQGDPEDAARKILQDFRAGRMGPICLQLAPESETDEGQQQVLGRSNEEEKLKRQQEREAERQERALAAMETAKRQGLELPPMVDNKSEATEEVGKGMFDGW